MNFDTKDIPWLLRNNDRDKRGLPIPFIVFRDADNTPHFTVNDNTALTLCLTDKRCGLCGTPFQLGKMWFIGGPGAAFHENGLFIDAPVHHQCGTFAMKVCPFIAAPNYSKRIDDATIDPERLQDSAVLMDSNMDVTRPPLFVFARTSGYKLVEADDLGLQHYIQPRRPWKEIEYWQHGQRIVKKVAQEIIDAGDLPTGVLKWWAE